MQDDETLEFEHIDSVFCQKASLQSIRQAVAHGIGTQRGKIAIPRIRRDQGHAELACQRREFYRYAAQQRTDDANDMLLINQARKASCASAAFWVESRITIDNCKAGSRSCTVASASSMPRSARVPALAPGPDKGKRTPILC